MQAAVCRDGSLRYVSLTHALVQSPLRWGMARLLIGLFILTLSTAIAADATNDYPQQIEAWRAQREKNLRSEDGWLTLAGLFWLKEGSNTIGAGETNDFILPAGDAPNVLGEIRLTGKQVTFRNLSGDVVSVNNKPISGVVPLHYDESDNSDVVRAGSVSFYVILRGGRLAIRAKDSKSRALKEFKGTEFFPVNPAYRFEAKFIPSPAKIAIPSIIGQTEEDDSPGIVEFTLNGKTYRLRPVMEGDTLFFIFKDLTSHKETYQPGRMLNTAQPEHGVVILDFNQAYNPPCAFTPYATCPLPPKENILSVRIEAGELRYQQGHFQ